MTANGANVPSTASSGARQTRIAAATSTSRITSAQVTAMRSSGSTSGSNGSVTDTQARPPSERSLQTFAK